MNTTASRTRQAIRAAAIVISSHTGCGCWEQRRYLCANCETLAESVLTAADNAQ